MVKYLPTLYCTLEWNFEVYPYRQEMNIISKEESDLLEKIREIRKLKRKKIS